MIEPSALTKSSPHAAGAERTAVGLRLLKPKRARAGKEESDTGQIISRAVVAAIGIGIGWEEGAIILARKSFREQSYIARPGAPGGPGQGDPELTPIERHSNHAARFVRG